VGMGHGLDMKMNRKTNHIMDYNNISLPLFYRSDEYNKTLSPRIGIDLWLNNLMLDARQTYLCHQIDSKVTRTEVIETECIPKEASFSAIEVLKDAKKILDLINSSVNKSGNTYWLYKGQ